MSEYFTANHLSFKEIKRIFSKIKRTENNCWEWQGYRDKGGYGRVSFRGQPSRLIYRVLYAWAVEPLPQGRGKDIPNLDHAICDNEGCCNPVHVVLGPVRNNTLRGTSPTAVNSRKTHCIRGHLLPAEPNDKWKKKRECVVCRNDKMRKKRSDPLYREAMKRYLHEYHKKRKAIAA